jgi:hypothetical protein
VQIICVLKKGLGEEPRRESAAEAALECEITKKIDLWLGKFSGEKIAFKKEINLNSRKFLRKMASLDIPFISR